MLQGGYFVIFMHEMRLVDIYVHVKIVFNDNITYSYIENNDKVIQVNHTITSNENGVPTSCQNVKLTATEISQKPNTSLPTTLIQPTTSQGMVKFL